MSAESDRLVIRAWPMVRGIARDYEIPGLEMKDVEQEGLSALMIAAEDFDPECGDPFLPFADQAVRLYLYNLETKHLRKKHAPVNGVVDEQFVELLRLELVPDMSIAKATRTLHALVDAIAHDLTKAELVSIRGVLNGRSHLDLAAALYIPGGIRFIEHSIQQARRKLREIEP